MVGRCPESLELGVATSTAVASVRDRVPYIEPGVAAIATQAYTNPEYGAEGLKLIKRGHSPQEALKTILNNDPLRELRQVIIIDALGRAVAFTGEEVPDYKKHAVKEDCAAAGNSLAKSEVVDAMVEAFKGSDDKPLARRLIESLEAGEGAGGDRRGAISSALLVADRSRIVVDLRVDNHPRPILELKHLLRRAGLTRT